ncbi:MAG TPA: cytochrome P450, partial [Myxococcaceae bacterium]|nr:cytochrome P450 [Myxococcaceae bacterium]
MQTAAPSSVASRPPLVAGLPLVGSLPEMSRLGMLEFIERQWHVLGDVFRVKAGPRNMVVVAHPDGVERILASNRENYVKGPTYDSLRLLTGQGLLTLEGSPWKKRRRLEQPSFHRESIRKLVSTMAGVTRGALADWRRRLPEGGVLEMHQEMMRLTLEVVGETLFGQRLSTESVNVSGRAFGEALRLVSERGNSTVQLPLAVPTPGTLRMRRALEMLDEQVHAIITRARAEREKGPTLLAMLLDARDADTGEGLSDKELRDEVITLFLAGHETTALMLTWGFTLLGEHPEVVRRMREEVERELGGREPTAEDLPKLAYVRQVIDEILRLRSPTWTVARDVVEDDVILGHRVCAGERVLPVSYLTHRHPDFWDEPQRFDPDRFSP